MSYFPVMMDLDGQKVLVVGCGEEGEKKVEILHRFGAEITLVAKEATLKAVTLASVYLKRGFEEKDIREEDYILIVTATDDSDLNERISLLAKEKRIPVNVVDNTSLCTFIFPAIIKEKEVVCAVSSGGKSPYVAQYIKALIRKILPENIGEINDRMGAYREQAKQEITDPKERRVFLRHKLDEMLKTGK